MNDLDQIKEKKTWVKPEITSLDISATATGNAGSTAENTAYTHS